MNWKNLSPKIFDIVGYFLLGRLFYEINLSILENNNLSKHHLKISLAEGYSNINEHQYTEKSYAALITDYVKTQTCIGLHKTALRAPWSNWRLK